LDTIDCADGSNGILVSGCEAYNDEAGAAPAHFIDAGNGSAGPERLMIIGNIIKGDFSVSAIWSDEPCDEAYIAYNMITNHTTGQHCIELTDAGTGVIVGNNCYGDTEGAIIDPGSLYEYNNFKSTAIDTPALPGWVIEYNLNHLHAIDTGVAADADLTTYIADGSALSHIMTSDADTSGYTASTMSLEAIAYWQERAISKVATSDDDDLFDVAGGPILITSFVGVVTTQIGAVANSLEITLDADAGWTDYDFSTQVELNADAAGTRYVFTAANESVLTPLEGADAGGTDLMKAWHCGEGMIEQANSGAGTTGAITWYMTYKPLASGVTVTAQ